MQGIIMIVYVFVICVLMYFIAIKPQKKEQKKKKSLNKKGTTRGLKEDNLKHAEGLSEDSLVTKKTAKIWNFSNKAVTLHYQKETERRTIQGIVPI